MSDHDDERVQQVIDELDPRPAHAVDWPVSRRQTLRALAAAGLLGAGAASASAQSAGGVIADEAVLSNYGSESVSDGWEVTIDDDVFALTASEDTIDLPDGGVGEELVTPSGGEASEIVAPDGTVVFDLVDIADSAVHQWPFDEGSGTTLTDAIGNDDGTLNGGAWTSGTYEGGEAIDFDGTGDYADFPAISAMDSSNAPYTIAITIDGFSNWGAGGEGEVFLNFVSSENDDYRFILRAVDGQLTAWARNGSGADAIGWDSPPNDQKLRIAVTVGSDYEVGGLFVNADEKTDAGTAGGSDSTVGLNMARRTEGDAHADTILDNPNVYDSLLSASEIQDDYDAQPWS